MGSYFLGIDNGGTSTKAVIFDVSGKEINSAKRNVPMQMPGPRQTIRDMEVLWQANCEVIAEVLKASGLKGEEISCLSLSGHGKGLYLWGKDGKPAYPGIISTDSRTGDLVDAWNQDGTSERVFPMTFQSIMPSQPVALLKWLQMHEPEVLERTQWVFGVKDYIRFRLTGEAYGELTDLSGSNLVNLKTAAYDDALLEVFDLVQIRDKLPPLAYPAQICGQVSRAVADLTGLKAGTPVAAGMFDIDACAIGMNVTDESRIAVIAGTWAINEYIAKEPVTDRSVAMNSLYAIPGYYLVEESSPTSAANHEWLCQNLLKHQAEQMGLGVYDLANQLAESVDSGGLDLFFFPYLYGGNYNHHAKACFVGLEGRHGLADMVRAVYEGIVFGHRYQVDRLRASRRQPAEAIRLAGGVVNSPLWVQMFADILKMPVETIQTNELGALGAVMAAAAAVSAYPSLQSASEHMVTKGRVYEPDAGMMDLYDRKYEQYSIAESAMNSAWAAMRAAGDKP